MNGERGAALITAMLVVALAATTAAFMMWQNHLWLRQVENLDSRAQAGQVARAAIDWGSALLDEDSRDADYEGERWASQLLPLEAEGGEVSGALRDAQGRINLNNLVRDGKPSQPDRAIMQRLFQVLGLRPEPLDALVDWMDADGETTAPGGAEDMYYLALTPPYRAANRALADVDELYRVRGFTPDIIARLRPFVTALPVPTTVNVNTAPAEVLLALCEGLQPADARTLVQRRDSAHFGARSDFSQQLPQGALAREEDYGVNSRFFLATVHARHGRARLARQALLERPAQGKTKIVWAKPLEE